MAVLTIESPIPQKDIVIKQNATFSLQLCIVTRDEDDVAEVVDTEDWEAVLQVRTEPTEASDVLLEASTAGGSIVVGIQGDPGVQVNIDIKIPHTETADLEWFGCAGYDLLVIYPEGDQDYLLQGQALLVPAYSWVTP
jgi:hypothetical protein